MRNLITDVAGLAVGNAEDLRLGSGVTAIVFDEPAVAAVDVRGGAPGTLRITWERSSPVSVSMSDRTAGLAVLRV